MSILRRRATAFGLFALLCLLWATAVPVGVISGGGYSWTLDDQDVGAGQPVRLVGETSHEERGWGMPGGFVRRGANTWTAKYRDPAGGWIPVEVTAALRADVLRRYPGAAGREGIVVAWGEAPFNGGLALFFFVVTCLWWVGVRGWAWDPARGRLRNLAPLALLALWPWLVGTSNGWALADNLGLGIAQGPVLVSTDAAISGTSLLVGVGCVLLLTRRRWPGREPECG